MKTHRVLSLTAVALIASVAPCNALITGLWNTGVDDAGAVLSVGSPEQHYIVTSSATAPIEVVNVPSAWLTPTPADSAVWIGPDIIDANQPGLGTDANPESWWYSLTFTTSSATPVVSGYWASDNDSSIYLNGVFTGLSVGITQFGALTPFSISSGFLPGENTLTFRVQNAGPQASGNPSGLIVTGMPNSFGVPDGGATLALLGAALIGLVAFRRRLT